MLVFHVQGSAPRPYKITAEGEGSDLGMFCTCPAGSRGGLFCKHSAALLMGVVENLREPSDDLEELKRRARGSELIQRALEHSPAQKRRPLDVSDIEAVYALARNQLQAAQFEVTLLGPPGADDRSVSVHPRFANGRAKKKWLVALRYSRLTFEHFDDKGIPMARQISARPWHVAVPGKTRVFQHLGAAAAVFTEIIGTLQR